MEYIIVGCVFVCSVNHGLDCGIFVSLGTFTVEVYIGTRISEFYISFRDRVASAGVNIDVLKLMLLF